MGRLLQNWKISGKIKSRFHQAKIKKESWKPFQKDSQDPHFIHPGRNRNKSITVIVYASIKKIIFLQLRILSNTVTIKMLPFSILATGGGGYDEHFDCLLSGGRSECGKLLYLQMAWSLPQGTVSRKNPQRARTSLGIFLRGYHEELIAFFFMAIIP